MNIYLILLAMITATATSPASTDDFDARNLYDKLDLKIYRNRGILLDYGNPSLTGIIYNETIRINSNLVVSSSTAWSPTYTNSFQPLNQTNYIFTLDFDALNSTNKTPQIMGGSTVMMK